MTEFIPDISHHQSNPTTGARISVTRIRDEGAAAVIARVGQGAGLRLNGVDSYGTTRDRMWPTFYAEAVSIGFPILPYWYIGNRLSAADNAAIAADWAGATGLKWMLDHEDASGEIAFYNEVLAAFEKRGLEVVLGYVPHWYWSKFRTPINGPPLVNSLYFNSRTGYGSQIYGDGTAYAPAWEPYGGNRVALVQFTNQAQLAGWRVDCSAFPGTKAELHTLISGKPKGRLDMTYVVELPPHKPEDLNDYKEIVVALPPQNGATGVRAVWVNITNGNSPLDLRVTDFQCGSPGEGNHYGHPLLDYNSVIDPLGCSGGLQAPANAYSLVIDYRSQYGGSVSIEPVL